MPERRSWWLSSANWTVIASQSESTRALFVTAAVAVMNQEYNSCSPETLQLVMHGCRTSFQGTPLSGASHLVKVGSATALAGAFGMALWLCSLPVRHCYNDGFAVMVPQRCFRRAILQRAGPAHGRPMSTSRGKRSGKGGSDEKVRSHHTRAQAWHTQAPPQTRKGSTEHDGADTGFVPRVKLYTDAADEHEPWLVRRYRGLPVANSPPRENAVRCLATLH
jgi:hypothetical protein